jgi:hypothetical protein
VSSRSRVITRSAAKLEAPAPFEYPRTANLTEVMLLSETVTSRSLLPQIT